jgi:hypothetical protein
VDGTVKFHLKIPEGNVFFTPQEIVYQIPYNRNAENQPDRLSIEMEQDSLQNLGFENVRMTFLGANEKLRIEGEEENGAKANFFRGNNPENWVAGVRTYQKLIYRDLYPDIDLILYGDNGRIKQEYRIKNGGDAENIRVSYKGAERLGITDEG